MTTTTTFHLIIHIIPHHSTSFHIIPHHQACLTIFDLRSRFALPFFFSFSDFSVGFTLLTPLSYKGSLAKGLGVDLFWNSALCFLYPATLSPLLAPAQELISH